jgi:hypothetical protein
MFDANTCNNINDMIIPSLFGELTPSIIQCNKLFIKHNNLILYGLQSDSNTEYLDNKFIEYYMANKINKISEKYYNSNNEFIDDIAKSMDNQPIHVILDIKICGTEFTKKDGYNITDSLSYDHIQLLLKSIQKNIVSMDIVEFNSSICTTSESKILREFARNIIRDILNVKEKIINIINENTRFLIYRPLEQQNSSDIGWYILSGLSMKKMNKLLQKIPTDDITTIDIDGEDYLVTVTSMDEQNKKTFYNALTVTDITLFPNEKIDMCFRLLNIND